MVAVNPRFTLLAFSLASLSLAPSADAAAIHARSSDPGSPSKPARQHAPMPMKMASSNKQKRVDAMSKEGRFHKSRVADTQSPLSGSLSKRHQDQARFDIKDRLTRRDAEAPMAMASTPGHVDITSPTGNSADSPSNTTTIGHLMLNMTDASYVLDASEKNMTTLYMVPSDPNHCTLQLPLFDRTQNATSQYCATFDPNPPAPEPLTMTPCFNASTKTTPHTSQTFLYDPKTGVVQPMWYNSENDGTADTPSTVNDEEVSDPDAADTDDADPDTSAILNSRDGPQNVTLVFVPDPVVASDENASPESASTVATDTVTTTVTASPTPSFAAADVDAASQSMTTSDNPSQSTSFPSDRYRLSTTSSDASTATPSFATAHATASSTTDVLSQSTMSTSFASASDASAAPSYALADIDAASTSTDVPSQSMSSSTFVSATSSDASTATASSSTYVSSQSMASPASTSLQPATSSDASKAGALDVQVAEPSSTDTMSTSYSIVPTDSASSYSSVPTASASSSVDPAAIAADVATSSVSSFSGSASASASPSSSASAAGASTTVASPPMNNDQAVYIGGSNAARAELTPVSTAPYQWKFRAEPRL